MALTVGSLFVPRLLPCVDYPEHLALADVARRLLSHGAPEHALFELNFFTYYGFVNLVLAALSLVLPIEIAGKVLLVCALALTAWAVRKLLLELGRPPAYAALFVPMLFAFSASWGFLNYVVGLAIAFVASAEVAAQIRRPRASRAARLALLSVLCALTHPLAMLVLCLFSGALVLEMGVRGLHGGPPRKARAAVGQAALALLPALVGGFWCVAVYLGRRGGDAHLSEMRHAVIWPKLTRFAFYATDLHADGSDGPIIYGALAVMASIAVAGAVVHFRRGPAGPGIVSKLTIQRPEVVAAAGAAVGGIRPSRAPATAPVLPFATMLACYLAMPMIFMGSQLMFPRLVPALFLGALIALPRIEAPRAAATAVAACLGIAWWSAINLSAHFREYRDETDDASRVIDALPEGRRASAVVFSDFTDAFCRGGLLHLAAWYAARKHGDWAFSFARYDYMPVRYRAGRAPLWPERGWEFRPEAYDARSPYARTYDLVLVKTLEYLRPIDDESTIRKRVFGDDAVRPRLLAHYGLYWAFDTAGLPARDGGGIATAALGP